MMIYSLDQQEINNLKKKIMKTFYLLLSLITLTSCTDSDEEKREVSINSQWSLTIYEPGFAPTENYNTRQIIWNFQNDGNLLVEVENTVNTPPILENGIYTYSLNNNNNNKVTINSVEYDYNLTNNELIISDDPAADGLRATFVKITE